MILTTYKKKPTLIASIKNHQNKSFVLPQSADKANTRISSSCAENETVDFVFIRTS